MSGEADWSKAIARLGENYNDETITFKNHGCCGHIFAATDGLIAPWLKNQIAPQDKGHKICFTHVVSRASQ